ncbi:hypothetical protein ES708_13985 [subsurface metagenome]
MSLQDENIDMIEREMINIRSLTDVLISVDPGELERHTLACLAQMIREAADRIEGCIKSLPAEREG